MNQPLYRLYTEQHFGAMALATQPEIERSPLATVTMQLLAAGIKNISKFEFLDAPPPEAIKRALEELVLLGVAVPLEQHGEFDLTELGRKVLSRLLLGAIKGAGRDRSFTCVT